MTNLLSIQIFILSRIHANPDTSKRNLAKELKKSLAGIQYHYDILANMGYIHVPFKNGIHWKKNGPRVSVTRAGKKILQDEGLIKEEATNV
jgi:predicted transcriptional regulator